jgi:hypothetical protein
MRRDQRQFVNYIISGKLKKARPILHKPPNTALVAEFHQRWWFSAKRSLG